MAQPALQLSGITKRFGALVANDDISLSLARGEVLALLGENGAGKSTLVSILFGHYRADAGHIQVFGQPLTPGSPRAARAAGIGMVHQHFTLADNLSVLDNVMAGTEPLWRPRSRRAEARARLLATAQRFGLGVLPDARVGDLSVGERQRVEILKALVAGGDDGSGKPATRILILDEPTAVLTPPEVAGLFATLKQLVAAGLAIVFISHKLDEVLAVADRVAVLRAGRLVADLPTAGADTALLAQAMVGREVATVQRRPRPRGGLVLSLRGATLRGSGARPELDTVDLDLHAGEVLAVAGVAGNGQRALADVLHGLRALDHGTLALQGRTLPAWPRAWVRAGVARIPQDRQADGVVGDMALWENAVLEHQAEPAFARAGWLKRGAARAFAQRVVQGFDVRGTQQAGLATRARQLSGGNMQKLILGRVLTPWVEGSCGAPVLIVAHQPTWGLDVGAVAQVHARLLQACEAGAALLLISEDLDEILALADRIAVMHRGRLTPARPAGDWSLTDIGLAMAGQHEAASHAA